MSSSEVRVLSRLNHLIPMAVPEFDELPIPSKAPAMAMRAGVLHFYAKLPEDDGPRWYTYTELAMRTQAFNELITELIVSNVRDHVNTAIEGLDLNMTQAEFQTLLEGADIQPLLDTATGIGGINVSDLLTVNDVIDCGELT